MTRVGIPLAAAVVFVLSCTGAIEDRDLTSGDDGADEAPRAGRGGKGGQGGGSDAGSAGGGGAGGAIAGSGGNMGGSGGAGGDTPLPDFPEPDPIDATTPFACDPAEDIPQPPRLWRLSPVQYLNATWAFWVGRGIVTAWNNAPPVGHELLPPFDGRNDSDRFPNTARAFSMSTDELWRVTQSAGAIARQFVTANRAKECVGNGVDAMATCLRKHVGERGAVLWNRPLSPAEIDGFVAVATGAAPTVGEQEAAVLAFQALLSSLPFVFRTEGAAGKPGGEGLVRLTSHELAAALAYSITDSPPDDELWKAANDNALTTDEQIGAHVARLFDPARKYAKYALPPAVRFFREYFHYDEATAVAKDPRAYGFHNPKMLVEDMDKWLRHLLGEYRSQGFLTALLTSATGFVRGGYTSINFDIAGLAKNENAMLTNLDATKRAGFLTQPAFLTAYSVMEENNPVKRGKFIRESLLCGDVPPLPINAVPPLPDLGPNATLRDKLAVHSKSQNGACWACHQLMDSLGLPFEGYDHVGRAVTLDHGKPVVTTGEISGSGNQDGPVANAVEMAKKLAASSVVHQCYAVHAFQFWMGRKAYVTDACTLSRMTKALDANGGDHLGMLTALFTSRTFLYRNTKEAP